MATPIFPVFFGELRLAAQLENLRVLSGFVHTLAERLRLSEDVLFEVELAVEEAATNIITHAYHEAGLQGDMLIRGLREGDKPVSYTHLTLPTKA
jgi:anti-sigma regulatory factor (Ser/Thr protein kinase)